MSDTNSKESNNKIPHKMARLAWPKSKYGVILAVIKVNPIQALIIAMIGVVVAYNLHYWVERTFKIDDAVGAVAVHGYAGVAGLIICGFVLNGYPSSGYSVGAMWVGTDYAPINPLGMFIGAIIMFVVLGLIPGWIIAKVLHAAGKLRIPRDVEIAGLDYNMLEAAKKDERAVSSSTR